MNCRNHSDTLWLDFTSMTHLSVIDFTSYVFLYDKSLKVETVTCGVFIFILKMSVRHFVAIGVAADDWPDVRMSQIPSNSVVQQ